MLPLCACAYACVRMCARVYACACVCMCVRMCARVRVYACARAYVCACVCVLSPHPFLASPTQIYVCSKHSSVEK